MEFKIGEVATRAWSGPNHIQSQQCTRVYRKSNKTITFHIDYSPEEMTTRLRAMFKDRGQEKQIGEDHD